MKKCLLFLVLMLGLVLSTFSQESSRLVKGRVLDHKGEPVIGTIIVKGTTAGTTTEFDGSFAIEIPEGKNIIVVESFMGEKEYKVENFNSPIVIQLDEPKYIDATTTVDILGTKIDPRTWVGSVVGRDAKDIERRSVTNVAKVLEGLPGVQLTSGGGQPGNEPQIMMRGFGSLSANSSPLIVLDGVIYSGTLSSINPADVEGTTLLKDATAAARYGSRGANGVLLITTKRGVKSDKPQIFVNSSVGFVNRMLPFYDILQPKEHYELSASSYAKLNGGNFSPSEWMTTIFGNYNAYNLPADQLIIHDRDANTFTLNPDAELRYSDNWFDMMTRTGIRNEHNISISNGDERGDYRFSIGYNNDQGIVKQSKYDRITALLNLNANVTSWLRTGAKLGVTHDNQQRFVTTNTAYVNPFFSAQVMAPIYPVYLRDTLGEIQYDKNGDPIYDFGENPQFGQDRHFSKNMNAVASLFQDTRKTTGLTGTATGYLEADIYKDLIAKVDIGLDYIDRVSTDFQNMLYGDAAAINGRLSRTNLDRLTYTFSQSLVWVPSFSIFADQDHALSVVLRHENYLLSSNTNSFMKSGYTDPQFVEGAAGAVVEDGSSVSHKYAIEGYSASLDYNYKRKYNFSGSYRIDGSSRFASHTRWGHFWSLGAGWVLSDEAFLESTQDWLSQLKLRISYGSSGNEALGAGTAYYAYMSLYHFYPNYMNPGYRFNTWGNSDLRWETNKMLNPGLDFSLFRGRLTGTFDFYNRVSDDLLYVRPYAPSTGIGGIQDNVGSTRNRGLELTLQGYIVNQNDFKWRANLNLQRIRNTMLKMQGGDGDTIRNDLYILAVGTSANGDYNTPEFAGVQEDRDPVTGFEGGDELWYISWDYKRDEEGNILLDDKGNPEFVSLPEGTMTNDYEIASLNRNKKSFGSPWRDFEGSFENIISYKNFEFSFLITFGVGGNFYDQTYASLMRPDNDFQGYAWHADMSRAWSPNNKKTDVPRADLTSTNIGRASSRFLISNSFLKLQSARLSYSFDVKSLTKYNIKSLAINVSADNIYLFTGRKGLDIQQSFFGTSSFNYFPYRTIMFGLSLGI